jgi:putative phosphoesterase
MPSIGVISDTHGLLRPQAISSLQDSDLIIHAGDIGKPEVLTGLEAICPVIAIRGNVDRAAWALDYPQARRVEVAGKCLYVIHDLKEMVLDPTAEAIDVVISGHSHMPKIDTRDGVLYLNPGSAGPRRFKLPVMVARLSIGTSKTTATLHELSV